MKLRILSVVLLVLTASILVAQPKRKMAATSPGDKPAITRMEPRGIQRGIATTVRIVGTNLLALKSVTFHNPKLTGTLVGPDTKNAQDVAHRTATATEAWLNVTAAPDIKRGSYDISVSNDKGESGRIKLYVDDIPQVFEPETGKDAARFSTSVPSSFWGTLDPAADSDEVEFTATAGDHLVFDLSARTIGSKANVNMMTVDASGNLVAASSSFDGDDPLVACTIPKNGRYRVQITEEQMGGSPEHFYRLSIGRMPTVTGCFPLSISTNTTAELSLVGFNVPPSATVKFAAPTSGEIEVPVDSEKFRIRKPVKVLVTDSDESVEQEPNDTTALATRITPPCIMGGRIWPHKSVTKQSVPIADADLFRFSAKAGEVWVIETDAARRGSPVDTKVEVLSAEGQPIERLLLRAVRDSQITFRSIDSMTGDIRVENWEEMELNELMYVEGEVCKIFRMPEGPDSGFQFYRNSGKRICYFDTSGSAHANGSLCYIVEPHAPGTKLVPNGLPSFTLNYANDDDGERELGSDSRLQFTPSSNGEYLIRVTDARGHAGEHFSYRLIVRHAQPDFKVTLNNPNPTVSPGSGTEFSFTVDRIDGFDGDINVKIDGFPSGFLVPQPLIIQAGHLQANAALCAAPEAKEPATESMSNVKITASAMIDRKEVRKQVNSFGAIKLGEKPKLLVALEPYKESDTQFNVRPITDPPLEITIEPGTTVPAWLKIKRDGHDDLVTFTVENLPHGVIVDNIGLNGVLIPKGENERQIFLRCAKWVPETDRLVYCQAKQAGSPTSLPVLIKVRKPTGQQTAAK